MKRFLQFVMVLFSLVAFASADSFVVTHHYNLNGNLNDTHGGPSLVSDGGTLLAGGGYQFQANQGLHVSSAIDSNVWGLKMTFSFTDISGFRKLVDFANRTQDVGLYDISGRTQLYSYAADTTADYTPNQLATIFVTRDASGLFTVSLNGNLIYSLHDVNNFAVFSGPNNILRLFEDDQITGFGEASGGLVTSIDIYGQGTATPEPASLALLGSGLLGVGSLRRRFFN